MGLRTCLVICGLMWAACSASEGEPCSLDSDCRGGLVCGLEGECTTFEKVDEAFNAVPDVTVISLDALGGDSSSGPGDASATCEPALDTWPCEGVDKRVVALFEIDSEGHGAAGLAGASQLVLPGGFEDGSLYMEFWVNGTFADACPFTLGFVRSDDDVDEACQPLFVSDDKMPFSIPGVVELFVYNPSFTPSTGAFSGFVDKEEILAALDPALRSAFEPMVQENVDTDGDGEPDLATFNMTVTFK